MNRTEAVETRDTPGGKLGRFVSEALVPLLVLLVALPANGIQIGSAQSFAVGLSYVLVASGLKIHLLDAARARMEEKNSLAEFFVASSVFYGLLALAMLKVFEIATS